MENDNDPRLLAAVRAGDEAAVREALAAGADPNATVDRWHTALAAAADAGRSTIVRLLLDAGAQVGPSRGYDVSPLRAAALGSHTDVVRILLAHNALAAEPGTSPPSRASLLTDVVSQLVYSTPTRAALQTLEMLLTAGMTVRENEQALLIAAVMRPAAPAVLRLLLDHGADPDQRRSDATPAIVLAARRGDHAAVDLLVQAGADVNAGDAQGRTALMHAVERNHLQVAVVLRLAGAAVETVSADGMTALRLAQGWRWQNIQFLLGVRRVGRDSVPILRSTIRLSPNGFHLEGDPPMFALLAQVITIALDDLGDGEWETRTGLDAEDARNFAQRLPTGAVEASGASWYQIEATSTELATARSALSELAFGTTRTTPEGTTRLEITDLLGDLNRQLGR